MAKYKIIKLCNLSPLHIGTGRDNYATSTEELGSDTLSAALTAILAQVSGDIDAHAFMSSFAISSAFPFIGEQLFLPKPLGRLAVDGCDKETIRKKLKKLKYIELSQWQQIVSGQALQITEEQLSGEFLLAKGSNSEKPYSTQVNQRVTVSRDEGDATPFYFKWQYYSPAAGLFCIVDANEQTMSLIQKLFELLGETGIGSDKSIGGGKFTIETADIELPQIEAADATLLLSHYIPTKDELESLDLETARYELLHRSGYMAGSTIPEFQHLLKKSIYMFKSSSIFSGVHNLKGKIADVTPSWNDERMHKVLRSGRPITLPVKMQTI